jgi:hypothetical protein
MHAWAWKRMTVWNDAVAFAWGGSVPRSVHALAFLLLLNESCSPTRRGGLIHEGIGRTKLLHWRAVCLEITGQADVRNDDSQMT